LTELGVVEVECLTSRTSLALACIRIALKASCRTVKEDRPRVDGPGRNVDERTLQDALVSVEGGVRLSAREAVAAVHTAGLTGGIAGLHHESFRAEEEGVSVPFGATVRAVVDSDVVRPADIAVRRVQHR